MASLFARRYAPSFWNPNMLGGPCQALTLREWEVSVLLCSLPPAIKQTLLAWLIAPTERRWPRPAGFARQRQPFAQSALRQPAEPLPRLLFEEIKAIRQTLDMPLESLHGITRDLLLVAHGTRLRQLAEALGEARTLEEIAVIMRPLPLEPPTEPDIFSTRWGGRWATFFAGGAGVEAQP